MKYLILLPALLGAAAVLQGGLNRQIGSEWGLASAVLLNNVVFLLGGVALFLSVRTFPTHFPELFRVTGEWERLSWWFFLPGLFGFCLVTGLPIAIARLGAFATFLVLIVSQICASLLWDFQVSGIPLTLPRIAGAILAVSGALLVSWRG